MTSADHTGTQSHSARRSAFRAAPVWCALLLFVASCGSSSAQTPPTSPPGTYPPGAYPAGSYPPGTYPPGSYPPGNYPPGAYPPGGATTPPGPGQPPGGIPPVAGDPINAIDLGYLRGRADALLRELVAVLPAGQQQRVQNIPLVVDSTVGEVNAFAACTRDGKSAMAITDGLLEISAFLAQCKANDELFGTQTLPSYIQLVARQQRPKQPIPRPAAGFFNPAQSLDGRKVQRQHDVFDELIAFILGHELAHHYLGHLPCTAQGGLPLAEVGILLSSAVPLFNQPNEYAADVAGTHNVLTAGARRNGYHFTEAGGLLTMQFFSGLDQLTPNSILFAFENSHPPPQFRAPIIQQTAAAFRLTGGGLSLSL